MLENQKLLYGRVFAPMAKDSPDMCELVDAMEFQGCSHLFEWLVPFLHEWKVREFYLNLKIQEDGGFVTNVRDISFRVYEDSLNEILKVKK